MKSPDNILCHVMSGNGDFYLINITNDIIP